MAYNEYLMPALEMEGWEREARELNGKWERRDFEVGIYEFLD